MSILTIAKLIPADTRKEILEKNMIANAVGTSNDLTMHHLAVIWQTYIEPTFNFTCNLCYERVLENYKGLLPTLIEMEKEARLLG